MGWRLAHLDEIKSNIKARVSGNIVKKNTRIIGVVQVRAQKRHQKIFIFPYFFELIV